MDSFLPRWSDSGPADSLAAIRFATRSYPVEAQFDVWREFMAPAIDLKHPGEAQSGFDAELTLWDLGQLAVTRAVMPTVGPLRVWEHVRRNPLDHWCLVLVRDQMDAVAALRTETTPGQLHVRSLGSEFVGHAIDREVISLYMPRAADGRNSQRFERLPAALGRSALTDLLVAFVESLVKRLDTATVAEVPALVEATNAMISACLMPRRDDVADAGKFLSDSLVERARQVIHREIYSPELTPDLVSREIGVSRSALYRLFEPFGGVRHAIQRERLFVAHAALSDPDNRAPILEIAEQSGFGDASSFSRAFRKEFGCSPRDVKAAGVIGTPVVTTALRTDARGSDLGAVLARLHS